MVTTWADPADRPAAQEYDDDPRSYSRTKSYQWDCASPQQRNRFFNGLDSALRDHKSEDLLPICKFGPPDAAQYVARREPGASVTWQAEAFDIGGWADFHSNDEEDFGVYAAVLLGDDREMPSPFDEPGLCAASSVLGYGDLLQDWEPMHDGTREFPCVALVSKADEQRCGSGAHPRLCTRCGAAVLGAHAS